MTRLVLWAGAGLLVLSSCGTVAGRQPTICEAVRRAVRDGSMPVELARAWYPECNATDGPRS